MRSMPSCIFCILPSITCNNLSSSAGGLFNMLFGNFAFIFKEMWDWRILPPPTKIQLFITSHGQIIPAEIVERIFMSDISTSVTLARTLPLDLPQLRLLPVALLQLSLWSGSRRINLPFPFPQWNNSSQEQATFVPKNRPAPPLSQVTNYICPEM